MQATSIFQKNTLALRSQFLAHRPKLSLLAGGIGAALVIVHTAIGVSLVRAPASISALEGSIAATRGVLATNQTLLSEDLRPVLSGAEADLASVQDAFPDKVQTTAFLIHLYALADSRNVSITNVQNRRAKQATIGQHTYVLAPFSVSGKGSVPALVAFVRSLESIEGYTLVVKGAQITEEQGGPALSADMEIYTRPMIQAIASRYGSQTSAGNPDPVSK